MDLEAQSAPAVKAPRFSETNDEEQMAADIRRADALFAPQEPGCRGNQRAAILGDLALFSGGCWGKTLITGAPAPGSAALILVTNNDGGVPHSGEVLRPGDVLLYGPGAVHTSHGGRRASLHATMPLEPLESRLAALLGQSRLDLNGRRYRVRLPEPAARRLQAIMGRPWNLRDRGFWSANPAPPLAEFERELLDDLSIVLARFLPRTQEPSVSSSRRLAVLNDALQIICDENHQPTRLPDLCSLLQVSDEFLRRIFQDNVGMPPMKFLRMHRLRRLRKLLRTADPRRDNVKSIAYRCGFVSALGRMAAEYRSLFGESPSETLRGPGGRPAH